MERVTLVLFLFLAVFASNVSAQTPASTPLPPAKQAKRDATRDRLKAVLADSAVKTIGVAFKQSEKNPYNFVAVTEGPFKNLNSFEIVIGVSIDETMGFRIYPKLGSRYVNIDKASNPTGLMRQMLNLSHHNFLYWGADDTGDIFAGYTITLESGFPDDAVRVILNSVKPLDEYVGRMRPNILGQVASH